MEKNLETTIIKDAFGTPVNIGDCVLFCHNFFYRSPEFVKASVTGFCKRGGFDYIKIKDFETIGKIPTSGKALPASKLANSCVKVA